MGSFFFAMKTFIIMTKNKEDHIMKRETMFDDEILRLRDRLAELEIGSADYQHVLDDLRKLEMLKERERKRKWYNNVDSRTVVTGCMMIAQTVIILNYEKIGFIASKAFPGVIKPKI